jgi:hypothetical protein
MNVKLWTPERIPDKSVYAQPAEMVSPDAATEDEDLYVQYADFKKQKVLIDYLEKLVESLQDRVQS